MTVAELIKKLEGIEDKSKEIYVYSYDDVSKPSIIEETNIDDWQCQGGVLII